MSDLRDQLQTALGTAYSLDRELSGGGMSRVFIATESTLSRQVVVKVLPPETSGQVSIERFRREISLAAQLQHPHIVPLLTAGVAADVLYFTMPYVRGESLRAHLAKHGDLPTQHAVRILREVASAIAHAHEAGVVHRDIKPDNILVAGDAAMVTDFGIAKALSESTAASAASGLTSVGVAIGTPAYMAPEQVAADALTDHRADIYSWGILAYELLSGATPFHGRPPQGMLAAHIHEEPDSLSIRRPGVQPALAALVMRCLAKRPADRPQRALELVSELDAIGTPRSGSPPLLGAAGSGSGVINWRIIGIASAALVIAGGAYAAYSLSLGLDGRPRTIAVLPCINASRDTGWDYLAESMSDELRSRLTKVGGLSVTARSSSVAFRNTTTDVRTIGERLQAAHIVQCELSHRGTGAHVTAELVSTATGASEWSEAFDPEVSGLVAVQDSVILAVAGALRATARMNTAVERGTANPEARDLIRRGRYALLKSGEADYREAIRLFESALATDPMSAEAHAGIAFAWGFLADAYVSPAAAYPKGREAASRAVALDSTSADGWGQLALAASLHDWNFAEGERLYRRALVADPHNAYVRSNFGAVLCFRGRFEEGLQQVDSAIANDPLSVLASWFRENCLLAAGRFQEAIVQNQRTAHIDSSFFYAYSGAGEGYREMGLPDSSIAVYERAIKFNNGSPPPALAVAYARSGRVADARRVLASLERQYARSYIAPDYIAAGYAALGEMDRAFEWMNRVFEARSSFWILFARESLWDPFKKDRRWAPLVKRADIR